MDWTDSSNVCKYYAIQKIVKIKNYSNFLGKLIPDFGMYIFYYQSVNNKGLSLSYF